MNESTKNHTSFSNCETNLSDIPKVISLDPLILMFFNTSDYQQKGLSGYGISVIP
jgi:hypothetical protein